MLRFDVWWDHDDFLDLELPQAWVIVKERLCG
jgi:hypothetical protein